MEGVTLAARVVGAGWVLEPLHGLPAVLWLYSCIQRSEVRPEKRQECWHYTALAIKCSSVRSFSACNQ